MISAELKLCKVDPTPQLALLGGLPRASQRIESDTASVYLLAELKLQRKVYTKEDRAAMPCPFPNEPVW